MPKATITVDTNKIALAKKMAAESKGISEIAKALGYAGHGPARNFMKKHGISYASDRGRGRRGKTKEPKPTKEPTKEEEKRNPAMKVNLPKWAQEAYDLHHAQGEPVKKIAKRFGVTTSRVYQVFGVMRGTTRETSAVRDRLKWEAIAKQLHAQGKTNEEISKAVNKSRSRVSMVLREAGLSANPPSPMATARQAEQSEQSEQRRGRKGKAEPMVLAPRAYSKLEETKNYKGDLVMPDRQFQFVSAVRNPKTGSLENGVLIRCGNCNKTNYFLKPHGAVSHTHAAQVFRNRGWIVGGGPRADRCPDCVRKMHEPKVNGEHKTEQQIEQKIEPVAEAPKDRDISREERRIIFAKLNDVYADENTGYRKDWTDAKVATDLGVPVEWVAQVRDENFGPERNAAEVARLVHEARNKGKEILDMREDIRNSMRQLEERMKSFDQLCDEFKKLYNSIAQ